MITVKTFPLGMLSTNTYLITDNSTGKSALVDPACKDERLTKELLSLGKDKLQYILLTHGHFDHIGGVDAYSQMFSAKVVISSKDEAFLNDNSLNLSCLLGASQLKPIKSDITLNDGDELTLGESKFTFLLTPGHTMGSGCFVFGEDRVIFSGDTLFYHSMGRVDFPTSNPSDMKNSLKKLSKLQGDFTVYPGHDRFTTLSEERKSNPYFAD